MADRPTKPRSGLAEPETASGEMRRVVFDARHELAEARRRIAELEAEQAQAAERRRDAEADVLRGIEAHVVRLVAAEVEKALAARQPMQPQFVLRVETPAPGGGFQPVALAPPILPSPRAPAHTDPEIASVAEHAKWRIRLAHWKVIGPFVVAVLVPVISAIASHYGATTGPAPASHLEEKK